MTIKQLPYRTQLVEPIKFDISIYPVSALLTTNGVQYETTVTNSTITYADLFSIDTDTYFPAVKGKLAWVYVNLSFEIKGGTNNPHCIYKAEFKKHDATSWTIMSAEEDYTTTTSYVAQRLEGYIDIDTVSKAPFDIRVQFKSDAANGSTETVTAKLKNDTVIRLVGSREVR